MAREAVQHGKRSKRRCCLGPGGFKTRCTELDEVMLMWWRMTKTDQKQRVFRPRLQREIGKVGYPTPCTAYF